MIIKYTKSPVKHKRLRIYMDNGKYYDFGLDTGSTYIDHSNPIIRENYWKRHLGNPTENTLIRNLVPSPSLFSAFILWEKYPSIEKNIKYLNSLWELKHRSKK